MIETVLSPKHRRSQIPLPLTLDQRIEIFAEQKRGWQLNVADRLLHGETCPDTGTVFGQDPDGGFAALMLMHSYFEEIAKLRDGYTGMDKVGEYFARGFKWVFPIFDSEGEDREVQLALDCLVEIFYVNFRCGFSHGFSTGYISHNKDLGKAFEFSGGDYLPIQVNAYEWIKVIKEHFDSYVADLEDQSNDELRRNFELRMDAVQFDLKTKAENALKKAGYLSK